jgi:hypothetical protein
MVADAPLMMGFLSISLLVGLTVKEPIVEFEEAIERHFHGPGGSRREAFKD